MTFSLLMWLMKEKFSKKSRNWRDLERGFSDGKREKRGGIKQDKKSNMTRRENTR